MMRKRTGLTLFVVTLVMLGMVCGAWGQTTYNVIPGHSIQAAIDGAVYGDTVSVAAGTYLERIMLKNGVAVLGAGEVLTVLDGQTGGTVVTAIDCGDPNTVLAGFTITNGLSVAGGGMYNENSSVTIDHCTFWNNATLAGADGASVYQTSDNGGNGGDGGAMYNSNYNGTITNCSFLVNSTGAGGVGGAGVDTVINSNPGGHGGHGGSGGGGGGMYNTQSTPVLINCIFFGNTTGIGGDGGNGGDSTGAFPGTGGTGGDGGDGGSGAGMCNDNSGPIIINCTMVQNGVGWGGSLGVAGSGDPDGSDGTAGVAGMGGGMYNSAGAPVVTNSIMWGNLPDEIFGGSPSVTYSDVQGGTGEPWFGVGCIDTDPMFVDAGGWDFHLQEISLCLDAGSNSTASLPDEDIDGEDRIMGSSVDMGFDEVVQYELVWLADPTTGGSVVLNPAGGTYFAGTEVTVTANVAGGCVFDHWSGDLTGSVNPETITMDSDHTITAHFHFSLSVTLAPSLGGTVTLNPPGGIYEPGTVVELDLEVKAGYSFVHWSEDLAGSVETETVTMDTPKSVTGHLTFDGPVIYVNDDASGANSGVSWGDAFLSLQDGLEAATAGKQIWVAAGTYKPTVKVGGSGHKFKTFQMKNGVAIYGGFVGNEVFGSFDLADRDWNLYEAVLSGDLNGNDIPGDLEGNRSDNCYHIFYHPDGTNLDSSAILDGFTITASNAFGVTHETGFGGGMFNYGCSPTISNCIFRANSAYQGGGMINWENSAPTLNHCRFWGNYGYDLGGGMLNLDNSAPELNYCSFNDNIIEGTSGGGGMCNWDNSAPTLTGCEFSDNLVKEGHGGGMYNGGSSPTLTDCTFTGNTLLGNYDFGGGMNNVNSSPILTGCAFTANTARNCGGIYNIDSSPILTRCMFTANTAGNNSGGMMNLGGAPILVNCGFMGNTAGNCGGGMMIYNNSDPVLVNCTFTGNSAGAKGGGIYMAYSSNLSGYNCVFYGNRAPIGYGVFLYDEGTGINYVRINNSILWDGGDWLWNENDESSVEIVYSDVAGGFAGEGNIEADPNFIDPGYWDPNGTPGNLNDDFWLEGDYRLQGGSPCIDTGSNYLVARDIADLDGNSNTTEAVPYDLAGNPRIADDPEAPGISLFSSIEFPSVDMGAYERPGIMLIPGDINGDGVVNLLDWAILCQHWLEDKS